MGAKGYDATGKEHELPTAVKDVVVSDETGVDRKIVAGTPVPLDLLDAYSAAIGEGEGADEPTGDKYDAMDKPALEAEAATRGLDVEGTGSGGNVLVEDLRKALREDDSA